MMKTIILIFRILFQKVKEPEEYVYTFPVNDDDTHFEKVLKWTYNAFEDETWYASHCCDVSEFVFDKKEDYILFKETWG